jgi:hypothetical protein
MECPSWLWNILLRRNWPKEFLHTDVVRGIDWCEKNQTNLPVSDESPIFIFAAGWRSGSTLLQRLLNSNRDVLVWGEAYEFSFLLHHLAAPLAGLTKTPFDLTFLSRHLSRMPGELASVLTTKWIANLTPPVADLKRAHLAYLSTLFSTSTMAAKRPRWGLKFVRGDAAIASYLRWLYPKAKILYLFRSPYASYRSYLNAAADGWYLYYPRYRVDGVVPFAVHWRHCMENFMASHQQVNAFLLSFESLTEGRILGPLQEYLNFEVDPETLDRKVDMQAEKLIDLKGSDRLMIRFIAGDMAKRHGYTAKSF